MSKFNDFFAKVMADDALKTEVIKVLGDSKFENATDEQLAKIGEIAKGAGFEFTAAEAKAHFDGGELDDDELDAVAGGKGDHVQIDVRKIDYESGTDTGYKTVYYQ